MTHRLCSLKSFSSNLLPKSDPSPFASMQSKLLATPLSKTLAKRSANRLPCWLDSLVNCLLVTGFFYSSSAFTQNVLVSNQGSSTVAPFDAQTGAFNGTFITTGAGGLNGPKGIKVGPDNNIYVASNLTHSILRFDGSTGAFMDTFVVPNAGGLNSPIGLTFGATDHNLYVVSSGIPSKVIVYDGITGTYIRDFITIGLSSPTDIVQGRDGSFYVANFGNSTVTRYSGSTGGFLGTFVSSTTGMKQPTGLTFGPAGNLYVSSSQTNSIYKYNGVTGALIRVFASGNGLIQPMGLGFGDDLNLYVVSSGNSAIGINPSIIEFDGGSGAFVNAFVPQSSTNLNQPSYLAFTLFPINHAPVATAGMDLSTPELVDVTLSGLGSLDPDGNAVNFQWMQTGGPLVNLIGSNTATPHFTAPEVLAAGATLSFQLIVSDSKLQSAPATVNVNVMNLNKPPVAQAGSGISADSGTLVTLDGTASFDPDGDSLSYLWFQSSGPPVTLDFTDPARPTFVAPDGFAPGTSIGFTLYVSDASTTSDPSTVNVVVNTSNRPPTAMAGANQTVSEGAVVSLNGLGSSDIDMDPISYQWTQISGPSVLLSDMYSAQPTFSAPNVSKAGADLIFQLVVNDGTFNSSVSNVTVTVNHTNGAPTANGGITQNVNERSFVTLNGSGSSDPEGDLLTYSWVQTSGPSVFLSAYDVANPTFVAPVVSTAGATLTFQLTVSDGLLSNASPVTLIQVSHVNRAPVADGGFDQTINMGTPVTLDGSGSYDADGDAISYSWSQVGGTPVTLNLSNPVTPTFVAPTVPSGGATLTFELVVKDATLTSKASVVNISVKNVNHPPVPNAGTPQTVQAGTRVTLDGSLSYDPDGDNVFYSWTQTGGPTVALDNASAMQPSFMSPNSAGSTVLTFNLSVNDGKASASATVTVTVQKINHAPVADAGSPQTVTAGTPVSLDGTGSSDPDLDPMTFAWTQTGGPTVALDLTDPIHPKFIAPAVTSLTDFVFSLVVSDGEFNSGASSVTISVKPLGNPPVCAKARVEHSVLWPPDHKMDEVEIEGIFADDEDDHGNRIDSASGTPKPKNTITYTTVTQDEATSGLGDGDVAKDAVIKNDAVLVRRERQTSGNGRVYVVGFTATNKAGLSCTGTVRLCVPKAANPKSCTDDGQLYNSLK